MEIAVPAMRIVISILPVIGVTILLITTFQGIGQGKAVFLLSLTRQLIFFIPGLFILSHFMGLTGVWVAMPISDFCGFLVAGFWLLREYKKLRVTLEWKDLPAKS